MLPSTRRDFLKAGVAATVLSGIGGRTAAQTTKRLATDWVTLGKSNVKVTRLAFGTGTFSGRVQRELGQEQFTLRPPTWASDYKSLQDGFSEAREKKVILAHGASVHGLPALRTVPGNQWLEIAMIRMNHNGTRMDTPETRDLDVPGNVDEVVANTKRAHAQGMGVISMKLCGEGRFTRAEDRDAAMKFAMNLGCVDSVTIGFKNTAEIDEAIERMNRVMNA